MQSPISYIPLLPITFSFIIGVILANIGLSAIIVIITAIIAVCLFYRKKAVIPICLMAIAIGWLDMCIQKPYDIDKSLTNTTFNYEGTVISASESETSLQLIIDVNRLLSTHDEDICFRCRLTLPTTHLPINPGDIVAFSAKLHKPENKHDLPDEWDMEDYLFKQGISAIDYIQPEQISVIGKDNSLLWHIRRLQPHIISLIGKSSLSDNSTEFLVATIAGDDSLLLSETRKNFTTAGLAHILALSGLHVGIIALVISIILFPLSLMGYNRVRFIITIILLWGYAILTGLTPSVTRAVIMTTVFIIGIIIQRRYSSINALCFAALLILLISPLQLYSAGFQLSFAAVISILIFTQRLNPINRKFRIGYYIASLACVSIAATLGTAMIASYYFHSFPIYFLIGNIFVIFLLPIIIGGGVLLIIFEMCGFNSDLICIVLDFIYSIIVNITDISSSLPYAKIENIYFSEWLFIPYLFTLIFLLATLVHKRLSLGILTILIAIFTLSAHYLSKPTYPQIEVFIPRDTYYTNIIARIDTSMYLYTTAHHSEHSNVLERAKLRYKDYMGHREIKSITFVTEAFDSPHFSYQGRNILLNGTHYLIIDNSDDLYPCPTTPNYAIICRGFKGDISDVYNIINADSLLLSYDLHPRRHDRYLNECNSANIPCRSLRNK